MKKLLLFVGVLSVVFVSGMAAALEPNDEVFIIFGETTRVLVRMPAASGEKFVALGDPTTEFWSKGKESMLSIEGEACSRYVLVQGSTNEDELFLTVDGKNYRMKSAASASGTKYEAENDSSTVLWNKGSSVTLTVEGKEYPDYDTWQPLGRIWLSER